MATARPAADLKPGPPAFSLDAKAAIKVSVTVRNRGEARAGRSVTAVLLSRDRSRNRGDAVLGRLTGRSLVAGASLTVRGTERLPQALPSGGYWLIACADARRRVRESSERNNCRASRTRVRVGPSPVDRAAPRFPGLRSATTCTPGPRGGAAVSSRFHLRWGAATDDTTPQSMIAYDVYQSRKPGANDFDRPTYTTAPGVESFATQPLPSDGTWYFIVRARDGVGNRDGNRVQREGQNLCQ